MLFFLSSLFFGEFFGFTEKLNYINYFHPVIKSNSIKLNNFLKSKFQKQKYSLKFQKLPFVNFLDSNLYYSSSLTKFSKRIEPLQTEQITISNTLFTYCSSLKLGGALFISSDFSDVELRRCIFNRCSTRDYKTVNRRKDASGGAFFIYSKTAIYSFICCENCQSNGVGVSFYSQSVEQNHSHSLKYASVSLSSTSYGRDSFCLENGYVFIEHLNSSKNKGTFGTGGSIGSKPLPKTGYLRFSHFSENKGQSIFMLQFEMTQEKGNSHCNFVNNTLNKRSSLGLLCISPNMVISKFFFIDNNGVNIFAISPVYLVNCYTDSKTFGENVIDDSSYVECNKTNVETIVFIEVC